MDDFDRELEAIDNIPAVERRKKTRTRLAKQIGMSSKLFNYLCIHKKYWHKPFVHGTYYVFVFLFQYIYVLNA